jgi:hypothetical protein
MTGKQNMGHICIRGKQGRSTTEAFNSTTYKPKNIRYIYV